MASAVASPGGGSRGAVMVDVARLAGVSQKVSRVVNGAPHVRPDVRERVTLAIEQLGYRPNVAVQALARERFDDVPDAELQVVPLTTVGVDAGRAAQHILAELLRMIEGGEPPVEPVTLPGTELIIRSSSGPVRRDRHTKVVTEAG